MVLPIFSVFTEALISPLSNHPWLTGTAEGKIWNNNRPLCVILRLVTFLPPSLPPPGKLLFCIRYSHISIYLHLRTEGSLRLAE